MKKIILMLFITFFSLGKEAIVINVKYDTLTIKKNKKDNEVLEIIGLKKDEEVIREVYKNNIFISSKRYKYVDGKKILFYERKVELNSDREIIIDDEIVYYDNGNFKQRFTMFPKGYPKKNNGYDDRIKFELRQFNEGGKEIYAEGGLYPLVSNAYFPPMFSNLLKTKEFQYLIPEL